MCMGECEQNLCLGTVTAAKQPRRMSWWYGLLTNEIVRLNNCKGAITTVVLW